MPVSTTPASVALGADVVGSLHIPDSPTPGAVVAVGGSDGGIPDYVAKPLAAEGLTTLALAYFGAPGTPEHLYEIPLEYVERGLTAMVERHGDPVAIID